MFIIIVEFTDSVIRCVISLKNVILNVILLKHTESFHMYVINKKVVCLFYVKCDKAVIFFFTCSVMGDFA